MFVIRYCSVSAVYSDLCTYVSVASSLSIHHKLSTWIIRDEGCVLGKCKEIFFVVYKSVIIYFIGKN